MNAVDTERSYKTTLEVVDKLQRTSKQLDALMVMILDYGTNRLQDLSEDTHDGVLWLAADLAKEVRSAAKQL